MPQSQPCPEPPSRPRPRRAVLSSSPQPRAVGRCELAALWEAALEALAPSLRGALLIADDDAMRALCWGVRGGLAARLDALGCKLLPLGTPLSLGGPHALAPPLSAALAEAVPRSAVVIVSRFLPEAHESLLRSLCQSGVRNADRTLLPATRVACTPPTHTPPAMARAHHCWRLQVHIRRLSLLSAYSAEDHLACNASLAGSDLDTFAHYVQQLRRRAVM